MITEKHTFSRGVLVIEFSLDSEDQNYGVVIDTVKFSLYNGSSFELVDPHLVTMVEHTNLSDAVTGITYKVRIPGDSDSLVRWEMRFDAEDGYDGTPCVLVNSTGYYMRGYAADISNYERSILKSADISCDCNMSNTLKCNILRALVLRAAERAGSPKIEKIFSRIARQDRDTSSAATSHSAGGCGCHG